MDDEVTNQAPKAVEEEIDTGRLLNLLQTDKGRALIAAVIQSKNDATSQNRNFSEELMKTFHTQFAENQRAKEHSFLQIVGFLGAVVLGYAYAFHYVRSDLPALSLAAIVAVVLLSFGSWVVVSISYNWRRDQLVTANIRNLCPELKDIFPSSYDPRTTIPSKNMITWMPNLLAVFFLIFPAFQIVVLASYAVRTNARFVWSPELFDGWITFTVVISTAAIVASCAGASRYCSKLNKFVSANPLMQPTGRERPAAD